MLRVMTPEETRALEQGWFAAGIPSLLLMEEAGRASANCLWALYKDKSAKTALIFCGQGNNGGDGLVCARHFQGLGGTPLVVLAQAPKTPEAKANLAYYQECGGQSLLLEEDCSVTELLALLKGRHFDVAVDALLGIGAKGEPKGIVKNCIEALNRLHLPVLSLDCPSGLDTLSGETPGAFVKAEQVLCFGPVKTGLCLGRAKYAALLNESLGFPAPKLPSPEFSCLVEKSDLKALLPPRASDTHKGLCGQVLIYAGSPGMAGASAMAALGALRAGAGLVYIACEEALMPVLQGLVPNAICISLKEARLSPPKHQVLLAGCGLKPEGRDLEEILSLRQDGAALVLDAGALSLLSQTKPLLGGICYLTPHVGEAARLLGSSTEAVLADLPGAAQEISLQYHASVVLKSHLSVVAAYPPCALGFNLAGSPALSKGGSGDALSGILSGLLAQFIAGKHSFSPRDCALGACLWLGLAAEEAAESLGSFSPLTGEILSFMGQALLKS